MAVLEVSRIPSADAVSRNALRPSSPRDTVCEKEKARAGDFESSRPFHGIV